MKILILALMLMLISGCETRSVTATMWSESDSKSGVIIEEKDLTLDGLEKLKTAVGKGVVYDKEKRLFIVAANEDANWGMVSLKVLVTPFTVVADGVQYTVVVAVANPQITLAIVQAILKR